MRRAAAPPRNESVYVSGDGRAGLCGRSQRPHRRRAGEAPVRARRDGALPGAHAVQARHGAGDGRARRHRRGAGADAVGARIRWSRCRCAASTRRTPSSRCSLVRGRVADVQPTAMVDLGKPAFKLGIAEIRVGWQRAHAEGRCQRRSPDLPRARYGDGAHRGAQRRRLAAARRQRSGGGGGRRRPARADAEQELESARSDDGPARLRRAHGDGADAR